MANRSEVVSALKHLNIRCSEYEETIRSLTEDEARTVYKMINKPSIKKFCEKYDANSGNLSRWMKGDRPSKKCYFAVISFLLDKEEIPQNKTVVFNNSLDARKKIISDISSLSPKVILFVDGDNTANLLHGEYNTNIYIIAFVCRSIIPEVFYKRNSSNFTLIISETNCKDATDHALTWTLSKLTDFINKDIGIALVSRDNFIEEVYHQLISEGFNACVIDSYQSNLKLELLLKFPSLKNSLEKEFSRYIDIANNIFFFKSYKEFRAKFLNIENVDSSILFTLAKYKFRAINSPIEDKLKEIAILLSYSITDDELRDEFIVQIPKSLYCKVNSMLKLEAKFMNQWISGRITDCGEIRNALKL